MHKVWRDLGLREQRIEQLSSLQQEIAMSRERMVPGKHGMEALMLELKEAGINSEAIPAHMHQGNTESQMPKDKKETPTVMVHAGHINKTITLPLPTDK